MSDQSQPQPADHPGEPEVAPRSQPYEAPRLERHGTLTELTQVFVGATSEIVAGSQ